LGRLLALLVALDLSAAGFLAYGADAETDLLLFLVHLDDLELVLRVHIERHWLPVGTDCLGDVAEALDSFSDLNEGAELRGAKDLALDDVADAVLGEERLPDIRLELLDAERQAAVLRLNAEDDRTDLLALLENFRRMLNALGPAQVRDVNEAIDAVFDLDEGAEVGKIADAAFDDGSGRVLVLKLLHAERDAGVVRNDAEDDGFDLIAGLDHLRRMLHPFAPRHFRYVDEAF